MDSYGHIVFGDSPFSNLWALGPKARKDRDVAGTVEGG